MKKTLAILFLFTYVLIQAQPGTTFKKVIATARNLVPLSFEAVPSGGFIVGGLEKMDLEATWQGFVLKLDESGNPEWKQSIVSDTSGGFVKVKPLKNGQYIGINNYYRDRTLDGAFKGSAHTWCKLDAQGKLLWAKTVKEAHPSTLSAVGLVEGENGGIYTAGYFLSTVVSFNSAGQNGINKLNADGSQAYPPIYVFFGNLIYFDLKNILYTPAKEIIITGSMNTERLNNVDRGTIIRVVDDGSRLTVKSVKNYIASGTDIHFQKAFNTKDGGLMIYGVIPFDKHVLMRLDAQGNVVWCQSYDTGIIGYTPQDAIETRDGGIVITGYSNSQTVIFKTDDKGSILWARKVNAEPLSMRYIAETQSGDLLTVGSGYRFNFTNEKGVDFYITQMDKNGVPNDCTHAEMTINRKPLSVTTVAPNYEVLNIPFKTFADNPIDSFYEKLNNKTLCKCLSFTPIDTVICSNSTITIGNKTYSQSGRDTLILKNQWGCDSLIYLDIRVSQAIEKRVATTICKGESYPFGNRLYTEGGIYEWKLKARNGCDSIIKLELTVRDTIAKILNIAICEGDTYDFYGKKLNKTGVYTEKRKIANQCDSAITLNLKVNPKPDSTNKTIVLNKNPNDTLRLTPCTEGVRYEWTPKNALSCNTCKNPIFTTNQNTIVSGLIYNEGGCAIKCTYDIKINSKEDIKKSLIYVPTAFSPNGDTHNDIFRPFSNIVKIKSLSIYNRWGNLIYYDASDTPQWTGQNAISDVYVYLIRYIDSATQEEGSVSGDVTILK